MKNKITKKRTNIVAYVVAELAKENPLYVPINTKVVVVKNTFYHSRLYFALRQEERQIAHIILSRKKDYILKVVITPEYKEQLRAKEIKRYFEKTFPCKAQKFVVSFSELAYSEQHPNDILESTLLEQKGILATKGGH